MSIPRSWPGVPKSIWPALNRLADGVDTALNWRTDGSLEVQVQGGSVYGSVTYPDPIVAMILGGANPYSWARVVPADDGVWYVQDAQPIQGWCDDQFTTIIISAAWNGSAVYFECLDDVQAVGITAGSIVRVRGVNPSTYDDDYVVASVSGTTFTVAVASDPGAYALGGGACFDLTGTDAFRPAYEENNNLTVTVGTIVRMEQRVLNAGDTAEYEYRFACPLITPAVPQPQTPAQWWDEPEDWWSPPPSGVTRTNTRVISIACVNNQIVYVTETDFFNNGQLQKVT